jgi:hypothetical protein
LPLPDQSEAEFPSIPGFGLTIGIFGTFLFLLARSERAGDSQENINPMPSDSDSRLTLPLLARVDA